MLFLGLPTRNSSRVQLVPFQTNEQSPTTADPGQASTTKAGNSGDLDNSLARYLCTGPTLQDYCKGGGIYDLQFHQIQDLLNQCQQRIRDNSGGAYVGPSVSVDGVLTFEDANSLAILGQYGVLFDIHPTPQWIADNASTVIAALNQFLGNAPMAWNAGTFTKSGSRSAPPATTVVVEPMPGDQSQPGSTSTSVQCCDGSIVEDMSMCPIDCSPGLPPSATPPPAGGTMTTTPPPTMVMPPPALSKPMKWGIVIAGIAAGIGVAALLQRS